MRRRIVLSVAMMSLLCLSVGCGSSAPKTLDAAGEAALRADLSRVEAVEQEHFRSQPPAAPAARVEEGANFQEPSF